MNAINFKTTFYLGNEFNEIRKRSQEILGKYSNDRELICFDNSNKSVTFLSERLVPNIHRNKPSILFLFSNPHPHSVLQGMFLSPNTKKRKNLFWSVMEDAGWIICNAEEKSPKQLAYICLNSIYESPFTFSFYCYYSFPTPYPNQIRKIFGKEYFDNIVEPRAATEFNIIISELKPDAVITFNKNVFNLVAVKTIEKYLYRLQNNEIISSYLRGIERQIPIYLTYPTGWRYHKDYKNLRKNNLVKISRGILKDNN